MLRQCHRHPSPEGFFPLSLLNHITPADHPKGFLQVSLLPHDNTADVLCHRVTNTPPADLAAQAQGASFTQRLTLNHSPNIHQNTQLTHQASTHPEHTTVSKTLFLVFTLLVPGCLLVSRSRISNTQFNSAFTYIHSCHSNYWFAFEYIHLKLPRKEPTGPFSRSWIAATPTSQVILCKPL